MSILRIHHPGRSLGAKVIVCLTPPKKVPTPATAASPASVRRLMLGALSGVSISRSSSTGWFLNVSYAYLIAAELPKTVLPI